MSSHTQTALLACGCFWGVEYWFQKLSGVLSVTSGYAGGVIQNPTYHQVCSGDTGHVEAVKIEYDASVVSYESILKYYFEIHDFTQIDGQGGDIGSQYLSVIFYNNEQELQTSKNLISSLTEMGYTVATKLWQNTDFYPAEEYHQNHYIKAGGAPYCHFRKQIWKDDTLSHTSLIR
jgi:methionine-S-sulfoxide reductase